MRPMTSTRDRTRRRLTARIAATSRSMAAADARLVTSSTAARTPATDRIFGAASQAANRSMLWLVIAAALASMGRRGRRAAADGIIAIGLVSGAVNGSLKLLARRARRSLAVTRSPERVLPMPGSFSFPSGHTASAFAFATAVTRALPVAGIPATAGGRCRARQIDHEVHGGPTRTPPGRPQPGVGLPSSPALCLLVSDLAGV